MSHVSEAAGFENATGGALATAANAARPECAVSINPMALISPTDYDQGLHPSSAVKYHGHEVTDFSHVSTA